MARGSRTWRSRARWGVALPCSAGRGARVLGGAWRAGCGARRCRARAGPGTPAPGPFAAARPAPALPHPARGEAAARHRPLSRGGEQLVQVGREPRTGGGLQPHGGGPEAHAAVIARAGAVKSDHPRHPADRARRRGPARTAPSWPNMRTSRQAARTSGAVGPSARTTVARLPGPGRTGPRRSSTASTAAAAGMSTIAISSPCRTASTASGPAAGHEPRDQVVRAHPDVDRPRRAAQRAASTQEAPVRVARSCAVTSATKACRAAAVSPWRGGSSCQGVSPRPRTSQQASNAVAASTIARDQSGVMRRRRG